MHRLREYMRNKPQNWTADDLYGQAFVPINTGETK
jgi:hypothetical protein